MRVLRGLRLTGALMLALLGLAAVALAGGWWWIAVGGAVELVALSLTGRWPCRFR